MKKINSVAIGSLKQIEEHFLSSGSLHWKESEFLKDDVKILAPVIWNTYSGSILGYKYFITWKTEIEKHEGYDDTKQSHIEIYSHSPIKDHSF